MTEDGCPRVSSGESTESSATKPRRKRKWDQPAESLVSAGTAVPGILSLSNTGSLAAVTLPGVATATGALVVNPLIAGSVSIPHVLQTPLIQPHTSVVVQKINQPKIQDELIAREIVINDADSAVRYKLTKRQTQEEIQKLTGAIVITRGKYRPPNAPPDGEKPLYLHISAGAHLETTVERIKAVDHAAAMVEEMLKQVPVNNCGKVTHAVSTCVYLGFEADPSLNIAACIRGPNDQYVNHIMNETGATVLLRGHGSGNPESASSEEVQQPLHLFLSSNNPKSLESAKLLAEHLLDTISRECGTSRVSSNKVYGAVPPPQQLLAGFQSYGNGAAPNSTSDTSLMSSTLNDAAIPPASSAAHPVTSTTLLQGTSSQPTGLSCGNSQSNMVCYPQPSFAGGTSYDGYGGIYPQATPLQQVALALRQSPSLVNSTVAPAITTASTAINSSESSSSEKEKRPPQKRKFQELPVTSKGHADPHQVGFFSKSSLQGPDFLESGESPSELGVRNVSTMPAPKKLAQPSTKGMPPPPPSRKILPPPPPLQPPRSMPPPPPKFSSPSPSSKAPENSVLNKSSPQAVPDTLIKLMEYGEEDDDPDEVVDEPYRSNSNGLAPPKPFWAV